jgi:hypothetical protein
VKIGRRWGQGGEMNQALYAHMNNKRKMKKKKESENSMCEIGIEVASKL